MVGRVLLALVSLSLVQEAWALDAVRQRKTFGQSMALNYIESPELGKFCSLDSATGVGEFFSIAAYASRNLNLILTNTKWKLPDRPSLPLTVKIDDSTSLSANFERLRPTLITLAAAQNTQVFFGFLRSAQRGRRAEFLFSSGQQVVLDLAYMSEALREWESCARDWAGYVVNVADGTAPQPQGSRSGSLGTGIVLSTDGHIVTNAHVVEKCTKITVGQGDKTIEATLLHADAKNDLALLRGDMSFQRTAQIAEQPVELGAKIAVFGFPLYGALSTGGNFTLGSVAGLSGLRDDKRFIQITAPIQGGNSGGPVVDRKGRLVGVVRSSVEKTNLGSIVQNVNFAIRMSVLKEFLDARKAPYALASGPPGRDRPDTDLASGAKAISVVVMCYQRG